MELTICENKVELGRKAAEHGAQLIREAIETRGEANIVVATGGSQNEMLEFLVQEDDILWSAVRVFHLDEYIGMPITHSASFRRYLWEHFARKLPLPLLQCNYISGEINPEQECLRVGKLIGAHPIDVAFVGIGENGHMAFNDPPADFETTAPYLVVDLDERCRQQQVGEGWFDSLEDVPKRAISISINQVLLSKNLIVSVPDQRKAEAVKHSVENTIDPYFPSTCLQKHQQAYIYLDPESASLLESVGTN